MRIIRPVVLFGILVWASAVAASLPAAASAAINISPALECLTFNATSQTANYRLAGVNADNTIETIITGDSNLFFPLPADRGQPIQFVPGLTQWNLSAPVGQSGLTWFLNGSQLALPTSASVLPFQRPCPDHGPAITSVQPVQLTLNAPGQNLTVFGQGLQGARVALGGAGVDAGASTDATANRIDVPVSFEAGAAAGARDLFVIAPNGDEVGCQGCVQVVNAAAGATGPQATGPAGPAGPAGPQGPAGSAGPAPGAVIVQGTSVAVGAGKFVRGEAVCPAGTTVVSGGYELTPANGAHPPLVTSDRPDGDTGWHVAVRGGTARGFSLRAYASCLKR